VRRHLERARSDDLDAGMDYIVQYDINRIEHFIGNNGFIDVEYDLGLVCDTRSQRNAFL
jgi:hypothetical protein